MDVSERGKAVSGKTLRDEHGTYPVWVSNRKMQKMKSKGKNKTTKHVDGNSGRITKKSRKTKGKKY